MIVSPPADSLNSDNKSVFFDSVQIRPESAGPQGAAQPIIIIGGHRDDDEHLISVHD